MTLSRDRIGGILVLIFSLTYAWLSQNIKLLPFQMYSAFHARTMPQVLAVLGVGMSLLVIAFPAHSEKLNLRNLWSRMPLTQADVQILHGSMRQMVRWKQRGK